MPVHNDEIARVFEEIADLLEIEEANPFRVRAYRNAARTVSTLGVELNELLSRGEDLTRLPGIGKDLAGKIKEMVESGHVAALDKLHHEVPASLEALLKIPGLGPKRVKMLYQELGIKSLAQLQRAASEGRLRAIFGFGEKTEQTILDNLAAHREVEQRFLRSTASRYATVLQDYLQGLEGVKEVVVAGSYRRGKETVGDLDILVTTNDEAAVMDRFSRYDEVAEVISSGHTRSTVRLRNDLQVDLRVVAPESLGAALHYFTGSKAHNIQLRRLGQQKGLKINEYGVFRGEKRIAGESEASVFRSVGLHYIEPELREGGGEIEAARKGKLPRLIARDDLKGDLHAHTLATDGNADLKAMALAAKALGMEYLAITDHSQRLTVAHGMDSKRLHEQLAAIDQLNDELKGVTLLKGCEVDILADGTLDLPDDILSELDLVVAAVHSQFKLPRRKQTDRILRAMDQRYFTLLAHPSGRLLQQREAYPVDMERIIAQAAERGCFLELNSQPERLDLTAEYCRMAKEQGVLVSINSDAHREQDLDNLQWGVSQARRGWLEKDDVLNTRSLSKLKKLLLRTMG